MWALADFRHPFSLTMHLDLLSIATNGHSAPPTSIRRRIINKQHLAALIIAHFQVMSLNIAYNHGGIASNIGKAGPDRMHAFPMNAAQRGGDLWHCE
jgi:hypothetical protein